MLTQLNKEVQDDSMVTKLQEKRKNVIDIEMLLIKKEHNNPDTIKADTEYRKYMDLMTKVNSGVILRGAINNDGTIESFYIKSSQKNLIATFFQLPGKPVKVGDLWPLDIHFIEMDQSFVPDTSYNKNIVTITKITDKDNDQIVTLKYDIVEFVRGGFASPFDNHPIVTSMKFTYNATADFSVKNGRWIKYEGVISSISTGAISAQETKRFALITE